eukprot:403902_1
MQMSVLILAFVTIHIGIVIQADKLYVDLGDSDLKSRCENGEFKCDGCGGNFDCILCVKFQGGIAPVYQLSGELSGDTSGNAEIIPVADVSFEESNYNYAVSGYYQYDSNSHQMKVINGSEQDLLVSKYVFYSLVSYGLGATILVVALACKLRQMSKMKKALKHGHQNVPIHEMDVDSNCGITKQ